MFGQNPFYHRTIRKLSVVFGSLFSNIHIQRFDNSNVPVQTIHVPLSYAVGDKYLAMQKKAYHESNQEKYTEDTKVDIRMILPRMSFQLENIVYDPERKLNQNNRLIKCDDSGRPTAYQYNRVPFLVSFTLNVITKKTEEGLQILEQILPFFSPSIVVPILDMPDLGLVTDIPIELTDIAYQDNFEDGLTEPRELIWTLSFTMKAYLYMPTITNITGIIEKATINFNDFATGNTISNAVISTELCNITPNVFDCNPNQTTVLEEFDINDVLSFKSLVMVEDPNGEVFRNTFQLLGTHNATTAYHTKYAEMGDFVDYEINTSIVGGKMKLSITNNTSLQMQVKIVTIETRKSCPTDGHVEINVIAEE